jgi:hypothetical protein
MYNKINNSQKNLSSLYKKRNYSPIESFGIKKNKINKNIKKTTTKKVKRYENALKDTS